MKRLFIIFIFCLNSSFESTAQKNSDISFDSLLAIKGKKSIGTKFPAFRTRNKFTIIDNGSLNGKVTYINFWFKDCPPCIAEMKSLNEMYEKLKHVKDFQFFSFTFESEKTIEGMRKKYKMNYPIFHLTKNKCYQLNQDSGFPVHLIVDKQGIIQFLLSGYHTEEKGAHNYLFSKVYPEIVSVLNK